MRLAVFLKLILLNFILLFVSLHAHAATIVNINSRVNNVSSAQNLPVPVPLAAGTYQISPVGTPTGIYDAWKPWSDSITETPGSSFYKCANDDGCLRTRPTTVIGWLNAYQVESPYITNVSVNRDELIAVQTAPTNPPYVSFFVSSSTTTYFRVDDGYCYPTALDALRPAQTAVFTLSQPGTVRFLFWDDTYTDNQGGISLRISAVPVPAAAWLLGTGLIGLVAIRRRVNR